jgi:hypothetical protein
MINLDGVEPRAPKDGQFNECLSTLPMELPNEKPFKIAFDVSEIPGAQKTNHEFIDQEVEMIDAQGSWSDFMMNRNGFQFAKPPTALRSSDFDGDDIVRSQYYPEVKSCTERIMPLGTDVFILGYEALYYLMCRFEESTSEQRHKRRECFPHIAAYSIPTPNLVVYAHW